MLEPDYITGLTLLGGEPLEHVNQQGLLPLLREIKKRFPDKSIWCYTGYTFEKDVLDTFCSQFSETREFLNYLDVLVDGEFQLDKKNISLRFKGSENQRIILVRESLKCGKTVLWDENKE